jgi:hypothetical protein
MVTIMYFVPQLGQAKAIGSDLLEKQRAAICLQYVNSAAQFLANFGQYIVCLGHFTRNEARRIATNIAKLPGRIITQLLPCSVHRSAAALLQWPNSWHSHRPHSVTVGITQG